MACDFREKDAHIKCSDQTERLSEKVNDESVIICTEFGLLPSQRNFSICANHSVHVLETNSRRKRRNFCEIPFIFNTHKGIRRKSDRTLTLPNVYTIHDNFGVVLAVGTGICRNCRKELLEAEIFNENESEQLFSIEDSFEDCNPVPLKRTRKAALPAAEIAWTDFTESSQENSLSQSSSVSCWDDNRSLDAPREALNTLLSLSGLSPVKKLQGQITEASRRTQHRYISKAAQCFDLICNTICPGEAEFIKSAIFQEQQNKDQDTPTFNTLVEIYKRAETWHLQRQILSIISDQHSFEEVKKLVPDVTQYKFKAAKQHCNQFGIGEPVSKRKQVREKFDVSQLDHFIDFILSSHIIKDQPFGEKTLKLPCGEIIKIPSVIRSLAPSRIIAQYTAVCNEENIKPLGSSTLYKLLDDCSALVRQSIEGLDNYVMEGCRAFKDLESVVQDLGLTSMESNSVQENLQNAKRYLKSELKVHVTRENPVADHCLSYALSSTDSNFKTLCDHNHDSSCQECVNMNTTLNFIKSKAEIHEWRNKEAVLYTVEESISAIRNWKSHVIRSRNQEEARSVIVDNMTNVDAVITCDWAMKLLPRKYREGQVDWFAKRGINWHITVSLLKHHCSYSTITHIHIFEQPTAQDAAVTSQILVDVSKDIMALKKDVTRLHFFSDNAGCYKSSSTLLTLQHELPSSIVSYNFCEAQNGKGPCDRRASHIKSIIKRHVNEGNDVTTAQHMKQAVDKENKDDLRVKVVTSVNILDATPRKSTIPCISQMYNFQFTESGLRMWKAYSVGKGKLLTWDHLSAPENSVELKTVAGWIGGGISEMEEETPEDTSEENPSRSSVLECPEGSCSKTFSTQKALENHVNMGNCSFRSDAKMNVSEKAKRMYADKILSFQPQRSVVLESHSNTDVCRCSELDMGWAIKENRQRVTFTSGQKAFMTEKFDIGKRTGNKVDPYIAAEEMRNCGLFSRSEFLSGQQISFFFSRLCQKEKRMTAADFCASEEEDRKDQIRNLLLDQNN